MQAQPDQADQATASTPVHAEPAEPDERPNYAALSGPAPTGYVLSRDYDEDDFADQHEQSELAGKFARWSQPAANEVQVSLASLHSSDCHAVSKPYFDTCHGCCKVVPTCRNVCGEPILML